jgi:hypothetical protein
VSIDVSERDRRPRVAAVDRRTPGDQDEALRATRTGGAPDDPLERTEPIRPVREDDEA